MSIKIKALEWDSGVVDWARPMPGMKYVACSTTPPGSWGWWLEGVPETRAVLKSEADAKAAAQSDYERRILSSLEVPAHPEVAKALREALKPFADACPELFNDWCPDETPAWYVDGDNPGDEKPAPVTVGDFRLAATAYRG